MNRILPVLSVLLTCGAALAPGTAAADPHDIAPLHEPETPEAKEARRLTMAQDMAAFLPRLVGRFRYEGMADFNVESGDSGQGSQPPPDPLKMKSAKGLGDCIAIGAGPGVQCVINVVWQEEWGSQGQAVDGGEPFLAPALSLYGLDPNAAVIRYLQLDADGLVQDGPAVLKGNTLSWTYATVCLANGVGVPPPCHRVTRVYAPPDGKVIQTFIEIQKWDSNNGKWVRVAAFTLDMHRVAQAQAGAPSRSPPSPSRSQPARR